MAVGSISFWQQDQNYWSQGQTRSQAQATSDALITAMGNAVVNEAAGLASIANQTALNRVNTALSAAVQSSLQQAQSGSSSTLSPNSPSASSSASTSSSASGAAASLGSPAVGTGTVPLTANTSLLTLGIPQNGTITVSDGTNITTYASTGTDTVGDLLNGLNTQSPKNAQVTAWLDSSGRLVVTGHNDTDTVSVGGTFASDVGFGTSNNTFQPTAPAPATPATPAATTASTPSTGSNSSSATAGSSTAGANGSTQSAAPSGLHNSSYALQTTGTAAFILAANGVAGSTVDLLA